ncbi:MAG: hypothetical protein B7Y73_00050 [Acidocella sp. 35-58-6]|nr:MAG: hypothetical protein B7Y73_00050 [Acidocella sp. 35-58-6]
MAPNSQPEPIMPPKLANNSPNLPASRLNPLVGNASLLFNICLTSAHERLHQVVIKEPKFDA